MPGYFALESEWFTAPEDACSLTVHFEVKGRAPSHHHQHQQQQHHSSANIALRLHSVTFPPPHHLCYSCLFPPCNSVVPLCLTLDTTKPLMLHSPALSTSLLSPIPDTQLPCCSVFDHKDLLLRWHEDSGISQNSVRACVCVCLCVSVCVCVPVSVCACDCLSVCVPPPLF